jgi:Fe-S-cluster-containing dehydrogenase component/CRP-like cAMP-binding protein
MTAAADQTNALLAMPLFEGVDEDLLDGLRTEASVTDGDYEWEPGTTPREGFIQFRELRGNEDVIVQGTLTTQFVIILHGQVEALQARSGRDVYHHKTYGPGDWFGEITTLSHTPALATYRTDGETLVAVIEARMFQRLYAEDDTFKERIDEGYRDNLPLHLRLSSLCRDLDDNAISSLQLSADFVSYEDGEVVIEAGSSADSVYIVRAGGLASYIEKNGGQRTIGFYKCNASFGEHSLLSESSTWQANYRTLMQTSLIKLPRQALAQLSHQAQAGMARAANRLIGIDDAHNIKSGDAANVGSRSVLDELFVMVERESVKGGRALVIDRQKCVRCNMCVESCETVHDDGIPRISKVGTPTATDEMLITACYHCETPQCMLSCEYGAIRRDPQGRVRFEYDSCVGCAGCIEGCPYGVIRLVEPKPLPERKPSFFQTLPIIGKLFEDPAPPTNAEETDQDKDIKPRSLGAGGKVSPVGGKTIKCDLCAGLPFEACVYNCPTTAIVRKEPQSLFDNRRGL